MPFCTKCGKELKENHDFCGNCGTPRDEVKKQEETPTGSSKPVNGKTTLEDGSLYEGELINGLPHGKGKMTRPNGNVYDGDFVNGKMQGKAKYTFSNGNVFEGDYVNGEPNKGKFTFYNGDIYEGDIVNGKMHGKGKYTHTDGRVYEGDYVNGKMHGKGKYTSSDGSVLYEGEYINGERAGKSNEALVSQEAKAAYERGRKYYNEGTNGDWARAIEEFTESIRLDNSNPDAWMYRGDSYQEFGRNDLAINDFNQSLQHGQKSNFVYYYRGIAFESAGKFQEALSDYDKFIKLEPNNAIGYKKRGNLFRTRKNFDEAIKNYTEAINIAAYNSFYLERAEIYKEAGKKIEAIQDLKIALNIDPDYQPATDMLNNWVNESYVFCNELFGERVVIRFYFERREDINDQSMAFYSRPEFFT